MYTSPYKWKRILFYGIYNNNRSDNGKKRKRKWDIRKRARVVGTRGPNIVIQFLAAMLVLVLHSSSSCSTFNLNFKYYIRYPTNTLLNIYSNSSYSTLTNSITLKPHFKGLFMLDVSCNLKYVTPCISTNSIDFEHNVKQSFLHKRWQ